MDETRVPLCDLNGNLSQPFCGDFVRRSLSICCALLSVHVPFSVHTRCSKCSLFVSAKYPALGCSRGRHDGLRCLDMQGEYSDSIDNSTCAVHLTIKTTTTGWGLSSQLSSIFSKRHKKPPIRFTRKHLVEESCRRVERDLKGL